MSVQTWANCGPWDQCGPVNQNLQPARGSGSEWHSDKITRSSKRHGASLWHGDKMTRCVNLAQRQNDTVRHFGTVCHFGTEGHFGTAT